MASRIPGLACSLAFYICGVVLLVAAILKTPYINDPASMASINLILGSNRWLIANVEFFFGLVIIVFARRLISPWALCATFTLAFVVHVLWLRFPHSNCGCFGSWVISPWVMIVLDALFACLFAWFGFACKRIEPKLSAYQLAIRLVICLLLSVVFAGYESQFDNIGNQRDRAGVRNIDGNTVILDPNLWIGGSLPIPCYFPTSNYTTFQLVLVNSNCESCVKAIEFLRQYASDDPGVRICSLNGQPGIKGISSKKYCGLDANKQWICEAPLVIYVKDSIVTQCAPFDSWRRFYLGDRNNGN